MMKKSILGLITILLFSILGFGQTTPQLQLSKVEDFQEAFKAIPCKNSERLPAVKALFLQMGAKEEDIVIEKIGDVKNIVIKKQGKSTEKIVVGAHYDLTGSGSCGATDNWTGIVAIAHLYRSIKDISTNKTILFVGFDKEEEGLVGSKAMVSKIKKENIAEYCAMLNIDGLGMNTPQILKGVSDESLQELAKSTAKTLEVPLQIIEISTASSDSASFREKKIPAATISEIPQKWMEIYHNKADQADKINHISVYLAYRIAFLMLTQIDEKDCQAFRKQKK